jgi:hypothetical protein
MCLHCLRRDNLLNILLNYAWVHKSTIGPIFTPMNGLYILFNLTFSVRHLNAIKSTAGRSFLGIKPLPALQQM